MDSTGIRQYLVCRQELWELDGKSECQAHEPSRGTDITWRREPRASSSTRSGFKRSSHITTGRLEEYNRSTRHEASWGHLYEMEKNVFSLVDNANGTKVHSLYVQPQPHSQASAVRRLGPWACRCILGSAPVSFIELVHSQFQPMGTNARPN